MMIPLVDLKLNKENCIGEIFKRYVYLCNYFKNNVF